MLIKKVYIANFGKLCNFEFDFNAGLNNIYAKNGYGKTTLATFIKVMFYGFSGGATRDLGKNERKRYMPWQGGMYGGYIIFETDNKSYKLEKYFGKTEKDDKIALYNLQTNKQEQLTNEIGELYFGIDADGFMKSIYFAESEVDGFENLSLQAKLSNAIENTADLNSYEKAVKLLDDKRKYLSRTGGGGKINEIKVDISEVNREIEVCEKSRELTKNYEATLNGLNATLIRLKEEKQRLENYIASNQRQFEVVAKREHLTTLEKDISELSSKVEEYKLFFIKHLPTDEEVEQMESLQKQTASLTEKIKSLNVSESDELFYKANKQVYSNLTAKNIQNAIDLSLKKKNSVKNTPRFISLAVALVSLFAGLTFLLKNNLMVGIICFAITLISGVLFVVFAKSKTAFNGNVYDYALTTLKGVNFDKTNLVNELFTLKANYEKWCKIDTYLSSVSSEIEKLRAELIQCSDKLNYCLSNYPKAESDAVAIQIIKTNLGTYKYLQNELNIKTQRASSFIEENNLGNIKVDDSELINYDAELKNISHQIEDVSSSILNVKLKLSKEKELLSLLTEYERIKENLTISLNEKTKEYELTLKTMELLSSAKEKLNSRFLKPMQDNLNSILGNLNTEVVKATTVDTDLNVNVENDGKLWQINYFSQGYKDLINFCVRIALIKSIYTLDKPFIILDDSFARLDEDNFAKVKNLLNGLKEEYQIIYFACSNDRQL